MRAADHIAQIVDDIDAGWAALEAEGTPIIERGDRDSQVTFFYRGRGERVALSAAIFRIEMPLMRIRHTDVFTGTFVIPNAVRMTYEFLIDLPEWWFTAMAYSLEREQDVIAYRADPANRSHDRLNPVREGTSAAVGRSVLALPDAPPQPWTEKREGIRRGWLAQEDGVRSEILDNERTIYTYLPPGYDEADGPYPLLVVFDASSYLTAVPTHRILDNLLADGLIPPMVAVLVGNVAGRRDVELPCNDEFARFLVDELLPWVRQHVAVSSDPRNVTVAGSSYGGLCSSFLAFRYPEVFGNVLSQSGSYVWPLRLPDRPGDHENSQEEPGWLTRQYAAAPPSTTRFYLDVGSYEIHPRNDAVGRNREMRDVLVGRGHEVHFAEFAGGHDYCCWAGTLADGLLALWGPAAR